MEHRPRPATTRRPARAGGRGGSERTDRSAPAGPPPAHRAGHRTTARCAPRGDRGAVLVEFAGIFPYVLLMLAVIWQCILIGYTFSLAGNAADQAARAGAAARGGAAGACAEAAARHVPDAWSVNASCGQQGDIYRAEITLRVPALFPGVLDMPFDVPGRAGAAAEG